MNVFDHQSGRRQQSLLLLIVFLFAMAGMAVLIHLIIVGLSLLLGETSSLSRPSPPAMVLIALVWLTMLAGGLFRWHDVRGGGAVLARRFAAVHACDRSRFEQEQRLLNVVAEIAIAATTPQPVVYVLRHESSINAFVLGEANHRYALVVTQGALEAFDRAELQAVIAHEFAHIANGDLPLNMRLLIALGGLMALDEVGRLLIGKGVGRRNEPLPIHPGMIVGLVLRMLGGVGVMTGQLIQAAYSRQREFLADASAVQFTRDPVALASALDTIRQRAHEPPLHSVYAQELAHLCFQAGADRPWYRRLLSTHPSLQRRIDIIEPHFAVKRRQRKRISRIEQRQESAKTTTAAQSSATMMSASLAANTHALSLTGSDANQRKPRAARKGVCLLVDEQSQPSDRILLLLPDRSRCLAAIFALFVPLDPSRQQRYMDALSTHINQRFMRRVGEIYRVVPDELRNDQLGIIRHASSVLVPNVRRENRQRLLLKLERLLNETGECSLMNYATLQLLRRKLDVDFPVLDRVVGERSPKAAARKVKSFDAMGGEFALLLSLMVESSGASPQVLDAQFQQALTCYTQTRYPRRTAREGGIIEEIEAAFQTLYAQPLSIREAFVQHCLEIARRDGHIARAERALLRLFAASLGCEQKKAA